MSEEHEKPQAAVVSYVDPVVIPSLLGNQIFVQAALYRFRLGEAIGEKCITAEDIVSEIAHDLEIRLESRVQRRLVARVKRMITVDV